VKKICIFLIFVLSFALFAVGCSRPSEIPDFEELLEINDIDNIFKNHSNAYISVESKSPIENYNYTEEIIYFKDDTGLNFHKASKGKMISGYDYTSLVGNAFYYVQGDEISTMLIGGEDSYFDYSLDFYSTPIGKGYIDGDHIVYHTYLIYKAGEIFPASRVDYTLYFNKDSKLIEKIYSITYSADHQIEAEYSLDVTYDVENVEDKLSKTAYDFIMGSDNLINLEIIANVGTPEQASYSLVTRTDSEIMANFSNLPYLLYSDSDYQNPIATLDTYEGEKSLTLYTRLRSSGE
jgi:hypothetical protein